MAETSDKSPDAKGDVERQAMRRDLDCLQRLRDELYDSYIASTDVRLVGVARHQAGHSRGWSPGQFDDADESYHWWDEFAERSRTPINRHPATQISTFNNGRNVFDLGVFALQGSSRRGSVIAMHKLDDLASVLAPVALRSMGGDAADLMPGYWHYSRAAQVQWLGSVCRIADVFPSEVGYGVERRHLDIGPASEGDLPKAAPKVNYYSTTSYAGWEYRGKPNSLDHDLLGPYFDLNNERQWHENMKARTTTSAPWPKAPAPKLPAGVYFAIPTRDVRICYVEAIDFILRRACPGQSERAAAASPDGPPPSPAAELEDLQKRFGHEPLRLAAELTHCRFVVATYPQVQRVLQGSPNGAGMEAHRRNGLIAYCDDPSGGRSKFYKIADPYHNDLLIGIVDEEYGRPRPPGKNHRKT